MKAKSHLLFLFSLVLALASYGQGQCPNVYDQNGDAVTEPYWISCSGGSYTLSLLPTANWSEYTINWGDGTANTSGTNWSSPSLIQHSYAAVVDTFVVTITNAQNGCQVQGVVVMEQATNASIQVPLGAYTQICAPDEVEFINSSTNVSETTHFIWDFGDGTPPLHFDYTNFNDVVSHLYDENGDYTCETTVSLTAENYCNALQGSASIATFTPVNIWTLDQASIAVSASTQCDPNTTFTFTNSTIRNCLNQGNTFQRQERWNFGNYFGTGQDSITNWTPWPPSIAPVITFPGIGDYTVTLYDSSYCGIVEQSVTVHVIAPPVASIAPTADTICVGQQTTFLQLANNPGQAYTWNVGVNGAWSNLGSGDVTYTYNNPGTYTVRCRASYPQYGSASCADTASFIIEVLPSPTISISADELQACDSITTDLNAVSSGGVNFEWNLAAAGSFLGQDPNPISFNSPGDYPISVTVTGLNGCTNSDADVIHVYATPQASFVVDNACEDASASFQNTSTTVNGNPIVSTTWTFGDGGNSNSNNPSHVYNTQGDYVVVLNISTPYCSATASDTVTVYPLPAASFTQDISSGCQPVIVQFSNTSTGAVNYAWNFDDGNLSTDTNTVHTFYHSGISDFVFQVELIATNEFGCSNSATSGVTVNGGAVASFNASDATLGCESTPIQFENTSLNASSVAWNFGDGNGSIELNPTHTYNNTSGFIQWYSVELIANSAAGCADTTELEIPVYPLLDIQVPNTVFEGCSPLVFESPTFVGVQGFEWDFGDGTQTNEAFPTHTYYNTSNVPVSYTVHFVGTSAFGCVDSVDFQITVNQQAVAAFTTSTQSGCGPLEVVLENNSINSDSYNWNYGNGSSSNNSSPFHNITLDNSTSLPQNYVIVLTAELNNGCNDQDSILVTVNPAATAEFSYAGNTCSPANILFTNNSNQNTQAYWTFGDGTNASVFEPSHVFTSPALTDTTYTITLVTSNAFGCGDTTTQFIDINYTPQALASIDSLYGCYPLNAAISNLSQGASSYLWNFGNGVTSVNNATQFVFEYLNISNQIQSYPLSLTAIATNGCSSIWNTTVSVLPEVTAEADLYVEGCNPVNVNFVNQSNGAISYLWDLGNGVFANTANVQNSYFNPGDSDTTFVVSLTATNSYGCAVTHDFYVEVSPLPVAQFIATPISQIWPNNTVSITNLSTGSNLGYVWNFDDGFEFNGSTPGTHSYQTWGTYTIQLIVNQGICTDTIQQTITIDPPAPQALFNTQLIGCAPLTVSFENTSLYAAGYQWIFGDGGLSSSTSPVYTYWSPGTYDVKLVAFGFNGTNDTLVIPNAITVHPNAVAAFTASPLEVVIPDQPVTFLNLSNVATTFTWVFGDGDFSNEDNPTHYYQLQGSYSVMLVANNQFNCPDTMLVANMISAYGSGTLEFPNAFTPTSAGPNDGVYDPNGYTNDIFCPLHEGVTSYELQIYNKWGELLFISEDIHVGWNGYYRGELCKEDVYAWRATATFSNGTRVNKSGDVTLLIR